MKLDPAYRRDYAILGAIRGPDHANEAVKILTAGVVRWSVGVTNSWVVVIAPHYAMKAWESYDEVTRAEVWRHVVDNRHYWDHVEDALNALTFSDDAIATYYKWLTREVIMPAQRAV